MAERFVYEGNKVTVCPLIYFDDSGKHDRLSMDQNLSADREILKTSEWLFAQKRNE